MEGMQIMIKIQNSSPIYEQIIEQYKLLILTGIMEPDEQMPSVRSLAVELSVNPNTIQRAYAELERQGFLYSIKGKGSFVKMNRSLLEDRKSDLRSRQRALLKEAEALSIPPGEILSGMLSQTELDGILPAPDSENENTVQR